MKGKLLFFFANIFFIFGFVFFINEATMGVGKLIDDMHREDAILGIIFTTSS